MTAWSVPGYTDVLEIGRGSSGRVVLATHPGSGIPVVIKYLADSLLQDEIFLREFRTEARVLVGITDDKIARLYEYIEDPGGAAIVMELVNGVTLRRMLREHGPTEPEAALALLKGSLLGLSTLHRHGVMQREYRPENVLVMADGRCKLVDCGILARSDRRGAPGYMAPEQWNGSPASPQTDIYAATATFYECLSAWPPYHAAGDLLLLRQQHESAPIPVDGAPEAIHGLLRRGLAKDPSNRPKDAATFLRELEAVASSAYGPDWEETGKKALARRARSLGELFPLTLAPMVDASTGFGHGFYTLSNGVKKALVAAAVTVVLVGGSVGGCVSLKPSDASNVTVLPSGSPSSVPPSPGPLTSLFDGTLFIAAPNTVAAEEFFTFRLFTCGPRSGSNCPTEIPPGPNGSPRPITSQGPVKLGSFIDVTLTAADKAIDITTPDGQRPQPVKAMDDVARWHWGVHATKPGAYELVATVSVLDDDAETLLRPTQDYEIVLIVNSTVGYVAAQSVDNFNKMVVVLTGLFGGLTTVIAFFAGMGWRRKREEAAPESVSEAVSRSSRRVTHARRVSVSATISRRIDRRPGRPAPEPSTEDTIGGASDLR